MGSLFGVLQPLLYQYGLRCLLVYCHLIAGLEYSGRDVQTAAVNLDMAVVDKLAGRFERHGETEAPHHVVKSDFQEAQQGRAGLTFVLGGLDEEALELGLGYLGGEAGYLLLAQMFTVVGHFVRAAAGGKALLFFSSLRAVHQAVGMALRAFKEHLLFDFYAFLATRSGISRHNPPILRQVQVKESCCYTLRALGGLQPLCGIGVMSLIDTTCMPLWAIPRMAVSRPGPGPLTKTMACLTP